MLRIQKKTFLFLFILMALFISVVNAQEWHTTNQITISWDAITEMSHGIAIPEADIIEYKIYLANAINDPDKANTMEIGTTGDISYVITLVDDGQYLVGFKTMRKVRSTEVVIIQSVIGWTDDPAI